MYRNFTLLVVAVFCAAQLSSCVKYSSGIETLSLNAAKSANIWTVSGRNSSGIEVKVSATVPGGVYSDLEDSGVFSNAIYHEYNDMDNRWVGRTNWTFSRNFTVTNELLQKNEIVIVCEGLDTISEVFINEVSVGKSENMFVRYTFDIKAPLKLGENTIRVAFRSPVEYAHEQYVDHETKYGYPVVPEKLVPEYRGENQAQMIRKMQAAFSWDWGPSYPNSGIWKSIYIEGYSGAAIRDVMIFSIPSKPIPDETSETQWNVTARVYYDAADNQPGSVIFHRDGSPEITRAVSLVQGKGNYVDISLIESGANTKLWWPNGYGDQNLYWYNISLVSPTPTESSTHVIRFGFRTVDLIEDFVDSTNEALGREFYFLVNGVKMYSKGSNSIPLHVLPERITESQTEWLLRAAKMSHQNMIRVWGGGMYETEEFYDYADEYGIFVWEDFMFACAMYPAKEPFLGNVRKEVETQVKRLQYRTSLAMWAGNNENEAALRDNWYGSDNFTLYKYDYVKLYIDNIKVETEKLDPSRKFISSSPTNGIQSELEGWVAEYPYDLRYGDIHFYNYKDDNWNWNIYKRTRFASEYGFQSFPHYETLAEVADNISTWSWDSPQMDHRQHHPGGQKEIRDLIQMHFPFPENYNSPEALPAMVYMAQLSQIMGQKTESEFFRRLMDKLDRTDGTGHNMGAMYWQLNDIWEGCSWASVEVNGMWKLQMYYAIHFFAPVLASPWQDKDGNVVVDLISDNMEAVSGNLKVQVFKLDSLTPVYEKSSSVISEFLTSKEVLRVDKATLTGLGCDDDAHSGSLNPCVIYTTLPGTPDNFLFLQYPKNKLSLRNPNLQITNFTEVGDGKTISFTINTSAVAPFVELVVKGDHRGYFSDNGFVLVQPSKEMTYYSENGISLSQFIERLKVMSLYDVTPIAQSTPFVWSGRPNHHKHHVLRRESSENSVHSSHLLNTH